MTRKFLSTSAALLMLAAAACSSSSKPENSGGTPKASAAKAPVVTPAVLEHGRGLYKTNCAACHGETGRGDGPAAGVMKPAPANHADRAVMSKLTDEDLAKVIQMGGAMKGKPLMQSNPQIRGADLDALVAYTRSLSQPASN